MINNSDGWLTACFFVGFNWEGELTMANPRELEDDQWKLQSSVSNKNPKRNPTKPSLVMFRPTVPCFGKWGNDGISFAPGAGEQEVRITEPTVYPPNSYEVGRMCRGMPTLVPPSIRVPLRRKRRHQKGRFDSLGSFRMPGLGNRWWMMDDGWWMMGDGWWKLFFRKHNWA